MPKLRNLKGKKIGHLKVLGKVRTPKGKSQNWRCLCICGKRLTVKHYRLIHSWSPKTHCGCQNKGLPTLYPLTYHSWWSARERCRNPEHVAYASYGGKGVYMYEPWTDPDKGFERFLKHIGPRPSKKYTLDRIDPYGSYVPGNVQWATAKEQARNKKIVKMVKHPKTGKTVPAAEAAESMNMKYQNFRLMMIKRGEW